MNNIYGSDVTTATEQELIAALKGLAKVLDTAKLKMHW